MAGAGFESVWAGGERCKFADRCVDEASMLARSTLESTGAPDGVLGAATAGAGDAGWGFDFKPDVAIGRATAWMLVGFAGADWLEADSALTGIVANAA